jgi:hypothetical protein
MLNFFSDEITTNNSNKLSLSDYQHEREIIYIRATNFIVYKYKLWSNVILQRELLFLENDERTPQ